MWCWWSRQQFKSSRARLGFGSDCVHYKSTFVVCKLIPKNLELIENTSECMIFCTFNSFLKSLKCQLGTQKICRDKKIRFSAKKRFERKYFRHIFYENLQNGQNRKFGLQASLLSLQKILIDSAPSLLTILKRKASRTRTARCQFEGYFMLSCRGGI